MPSSPSFFETDCASSSIFAGVTCGPGNDAKSIGSMSATSPIPGVARKMSALDSAGTAPPEASSNFIAIVPPVKKIAMRGFMTRAC